MDRFTLIFSFLASLALSVDAVDESDHPYFVNQVAFQNDENNCTFDIAGTDDWFIQVVASNDFVMTLHLHENADTGDIGSSVTVPKASDPTVKELVDIHIAGNDTYDDGVVVELTNDDSSDETVLLLLFGSDTPASRFSDATVVTSESVAEGMMWGLNGTGWIRGDFQWSSTVTCTLGTHPDEQTFVAPVDPTTEDPTEALTTGEDTTTGEETTTEEATNTSTAASGRIPNDPLSPSFINNIQANTMGDGCGNFYGVEVAYSETLTAAYVSIYDKDGLLLRRTELGDLTSEETVKRFAGVEYAITEWAESMIFMFGIEVDGVDQVIELIAVGNVDAGEIDGVPVMSLPMNGSTLKLGEDSIFRVISKASGNTEGWTAGDFGWRISVGGGGDCYWLKTNNDQVWSGDYVDGGGSTVTTSAPSGAKGSSIVSLLMATFASSIFI